MFLCFRNMIKISTLLLLMSLQWVMAQLPNPEKMKEVPLKNKSYTNGEELHYACSFGIFPVGRAITRIDKRIFYVGGRKCYKIDCFGETSPLISIVSKIKDQWGAYIDSANVVTHVSYRKLREGGYRKDEWVTFDHKTDSAYVKVIDYEKGKYTTPKSYKTCTDVRDLVAGFMYLRAVNFDLIKRGDTIAISGFFEDTTYKLRVIFEGTEMIKCKLGKVLCYKLVPIMPANKLFDGENSISCWISADANQIPVKIYAKMFVGGTGVELVDYKGLRSPVLIK